MNKISQEDIIRLPHHVSQKRPQMAVLQRAAQFSAFAALSGYDTALREAERLTDEKPELSEDQIGEINAKLRFLRDHPDRRGETSITYFRPDGKKAGGSYETCRGIVSGIDSTGKYLLMEAGIRIPIEDIMEIACDQYEAEQSYKKSHLS